MRRRIRPAAAARAGRGRRAHLEVVDAHPFIAGRVRRDHSEVHQLPVVDRRGQRRSHRGDCDRFAGSGRRVGDVAARRVSEVARAAHPVLDGHGLDGVGRRGIDVAQQERDRDPRAPARVERDQEMGRAGGGGALDRDHRVRQLELDHSGGQADGARVGAVGRDVDRRGRAVRQDFARVDARLSDDAVAAIPDDRGDA